MFQNNIADGNAVFFKDQNSSAKNFCLFKNKFKDMTTQSLGSYSNEIWQIILRVGNNLFCFI